MTHRILAWTLGLALMGCTPDPEPAPSAPTPAPTEPVEAPEEPPAPVEPPPLAEAREVRVRASDGTELVGDLRPGITAEAPLVILVHQLSTNRAEWEPLLRHLGAPPAMSTFAVDMRGHGQSTLRGGREVSWEGFAQADWEKLAGDVGAVIEHLRAEEGLAPAQITLVGSSIGSSAVILAAAEREDVHAVVAISPGRAYRGLDALTPLTRLGERPLLAVAAAEETGAAATAEDMARIAASGEALIAAGSSRHGVGLFEDSPETLTRVVAFVRQR